MKKQALLFLLLGVCHLQAYSQPSYHSTDLNPVELVNPLMGTDSDFSLSNGNTYPAIALPWGMNFWTPMTSKMGDGWTYKYDENKIRGIKQTHQPSPWINDYAAFSLMPVTGEMKFREEDRASWFSHKAEKAGPHYYKVYLADHDVTTEITPTERAAQFRFTFPETDEAYIVLDAFNEGSMVRILPKEQKIIGYCRNNSGGVPENFHNYFVLEFDKPFTVAHSWSDTTLLTTKLEAEGAHVGAVIGFPTAAGEQVQVKVASSFISPEQAALNLQREIGADDFDETLAKATIAWNKELNRIQIEDDDLDNMKTFYSCLYRLLLFPRKFYELDAEGKVVHYSPYNGEVLPGYLFTDNGFWDTFRAVFPFFTLMYPDLNSQIMQGLVNTYKESGWLPEWASPGHRDCMIGSNSASLIADAYVKGIRGYDIDLLYEAAVQNTGGKGPVSSVGRYGAEYYNDLGYVPYDVGINENAARTLEYAYADFALWQLAKALDRPAEEADLWKKRAHNYEHLFDPSTNLMRGKNKNGQFQTPFNPFKWGDAFTEGNSWHYSWSVFHDVQGYIDLIGSREAFAAKLDSVFNLASVYDESYYGFVIHEIREMQIVGMGQYAHGNQPIQHLVYLYNYAGQPWKSQQRVRSVMDKLYSAAPDGYCGDEDNGQTSAWYVFSAMGFYPVCPGTPEYVLGSPLFKKMRLQLENGNIFDIIAKDNKNGSPYIQSSRLNGQLCEKTWIGHQQIREGGILELQMGERPNEEWATAPEAVPYSMSRK
ncbi:MAG: GH92 family glycosyl hydrolase [Lewinella sp.]|nr:GH92 family glycosyl hydrolase [Lewinella sp.]